MPHNLETRITRLVEDYLVDYAEGKDIDHIETFDHPDKETVIDLIGKLRELVFPGYFRNRFHRIYTVRNHTAMLLEDVSCHLMQQVSVCLRYAPEYEQANEETLTAKAEEITFAFLEQLPKIRAYLETDVQAFYDGDPAAYNKDEIIYSYPGLYAILVNRLAHELFLLGVPLIPRIMTEHAHSLTGIDIHPGATIGKYFFIDHGTGIVIGETTEIGDNVKIYQGVTLGALSTRGGQSLRSRKRHPTIRDNVTIYSGASILGGETVIGRDVVIGGNAFITKSVADGARVSIKNLELHYKYGAGHSAPKEIEQDEAWFYVI